MQLSKFHLKQFRQPVSRLFILAIIGLVVSTTVSAVWPKPVSAATYTSVSDKAEQEYKSWASFNFVSFCMNHSNDTISKGGDGYSTAQDWNDSNFGHNTVDVGSILESDDSELACDDGHDLMIALRNLDYSSINQFLSEYYPKDASNCDGDDCKNIDNATMRAKISKRVQDKGWAGIAKDDTNVDDLSLAARYWFWNHYFKFPCDGKSHSYSNLANYSVNKSNENSDPNKPGEGPEGMRVWLIDDDNQPIEKNWFSFAIEDDNGIQGLGFKHNTTPATVAGGDDMQAKNCIEVGNEMTQNRASSFSNYLTQATEDCVAAGSSAADCQALSTQDTSGTLGSNTNEDNSCEAQGSLAWITCPVIKMIGGALNWVDTQVSRLLQIDRDKYAEGPASSGLYSAWSQFRNIGLTLLIAAMLLMVISTALGISFFDAYTVKKAFPRMVVAVVFMMMSWYVCIFLIDISNIVGRGVLGLMTAPFGESAQSLTTLFEGNAFAGILSLGVGGAAVVTGATLIAFSGPVQVIVLTWIGSALLAVGAAFLTIIARQMFIIVLIMVSPIAILSWIFPGNDKLWKSWWQLFSKLLIMYPMIMALIASGRIFAFVIDNGGGGAGLLDFLLKLTAYVLPYAVIPATFAAAGGAFNAVVGKVNDRSKGLGDRLKNTRKNQYKKASEKAAGGTLLRGGNGETGYRSRFNRGVKAGALIAAGRANPLKAGSLDSASAVAEQHHAEELLEKNDDIKAIINDDDLVSALAEHKGRAAISAFLASKGRFGQEGSDELARTVSLVERAQNAGTMEAMRMVGVVGHAASGTGFETHTDMYAAIKKASGGNAQVEGALLAKARSASERARRGELAAPGHVDQANEIRNMQLDGNGNVVNKEAVNGRMRRAAMRAGGAQTLVNMREKPFQQMMAELGEDYNDAVSRGLTEQATEIASEITSMRSAMAAAPPANRQAIAAMLAGVGVDARAVGENGPISTDEQLGQALARRAAEQAGGGWSESDILKEAQRITQDIRTRAGAYDVGGTANLTPEQLEARRRAQPEVPPGTGGDDTTN